MAWRRQNLHSAALCRVACRLHALRIALQAQVAGVVVVVGAGSTAFCYFYSCAAMRWKGGSFCSYQPCSTASVALPLDWQSRVSICDVVGQGSVLYGGINASWLCGHARGGGDCVSVVCRRGETRIVLMHLSPSMQANRKGQCGAAGAV